MRPLRERETKVNEDLCFHPHPKDAPIYFLQPGGTTRQFWTGNRPIFGHLQSYADFLRVGTKITSRLYKVVKQTSLENCLGVIRASTNALITQLLTIGQIFSSSFSTPPSMIASNYCP